MTSFDSEKTMELYFFIRLNIFKRCISWRVWIVKNNLFTIYKSQNVVKLPNRQRTERLTEVQKKYFQSYATNNPFVISFMTQSGLLQYHF